MIKWGVGMFNIDWDFDNYKPKESGWYGLILTGDSVDDITIGAAYFDGTYFRTRNDKRENISAFTTAAFDDKRSALCWADKNRVDW